MGNSKVSKYNKNKWIFNDFKTAHGHPKAALSSLQEPPRTPSKDPPDLPMSPKECTRDVRPTPRGRKETSKAPQEAPRRFPELQGTPKILPKSS